MGLFSNKKEFCAICKSAVSRTSKPKKEWNVKGPLCASCYVDLMKKSHGRENNIDDMCVTCGAEPGGLYLLKPKKEWNLKGWLCEPCFNEREKVENELKKNCILCNAKLGFIVRHPKKEWNIGGYLCKNCWNLQESKT